MLTGLDATLTNRVPFLPRFGLTVASTAALFSAPLCSACLSAVAKARLAAISCGPLKEIKGSHAQHMAFSRSSNHGPKQLMGL